MLLGDDAVKLVPQRGADLPLQAWAKQLGSTYAVLGRQKQMDKEELVAWADYDEYCLLQSEADAARAERAQRNRMLKQARLAAGGTPHASVT